MHVCVRAFVRVFKLKPITRELTPTQQDNIHTYRLTSAASKCLIQWHDSTPPIITGAYQFLVQNEPHDSRSLLPDTLADGRQR